MPPLTQTMGVYIIYPQDQKYEKKLSYEKDMMSKLIEALPKYDKFSQKFHPQITNWLPFYWKGFSQTTRYTYVIDNINDMDSVVANFSHAKRKNIKRAEKIVKVTFDLSAKAFYDNHKLTLSKQHQTISYDYFTFKSIYDSAIANDSGVIISAIDGGGEIHSALFVVWDTNSAYDLISTIDPDYRNSGSASLLIREAIRYVSSRTKYFDFEGSMIENVEASFRQFGAIQTPYHDIRKYSSQFLRMGSMLANMIAKKG